MHSNQYTFVGWLTIINAIATIPILAFNIFMEYISKQVPAVNLLLIISSTVILIVNSFIYFKFRELLNQKYNFHETDNIILLIIFGNILIGFFNIIGFTAPPIQTSMKILILILLFPFGIMHIMFAVKLHRLKNNLFGLLTPYVYTTIAVGVCVATVILFLLGVLIGVAAGLMQGLIFLKSAEEAEFV